MKEPTEAQIKEFWEWCECLEIKQFPTTHPLLGSEDVVMVDAYVWKPTGQRLGHQVGIADFPPIDLNNLFKYAESQAVEKIMEIFKVGRTFARLTLFNWWTENINKGMATELALFWALWEVREIKYEYKSNRYQAS